MKKSVCKLIYGYLALTYAILFFGVLISDTLYEERARILCASSVPRNFVDGIMNVPTAVVWLLFALMIGATAVCASFLRQFTLGIGISNGLLGLFTLIVYGGQLRQFIPFSFDMPTVRSSFLVIGSYLIVLVSLVLAPMIIFSKDDDQFDRIF
jgi:hypothetical protein